MTAFGLNALMRRLLASAVYGKTVEISDKLLMSVKIGDPVIALTYLVEELREKYPPWLKKFKSYFKIIKNA
jgi:hypothetical protein